MRSKKLDIPIDSLYMIENAVRHKERTWHKLVAKGNVSFNYMNMERVTLTYFNLPRTYLKRGNKKS